MRQRNETDKEGTEMDKVAERERERGGVVTEGQLEGERYIAMGRKRNMTEKKKGR